MRLGYSFKFPTLIFLWQFVVYLDYTVNIFAWRPETTTPMHINIYREEWHELRQANAKSSKLWVSLLKFINRKGILSKNSFSFPVQIHSAISHNIRIKRLRKMFTVLIIIQHITNCAYMCIRIVNIWSLGSQFATFIHYDFPWLQKSFSWFYWLTIFQDEISMHNLQWLWTDHPNHEITLTITRHHLIKWRNSQDNGYGNKSLLFFATIWIYTEEHYGCWRQLRQLKEWMGLSPIPFRHNFDVLKKTIIKFANDLI